MADKEGPDQNKGKKTKQKERMNKNQLKTDVNSKQNSKKLSKEIPTKQKSETNTESITLDIVEKDQHEVEEKIVIKLTSIDTNAKTDRLRTKVEKDYENHIDIVENKKLKESEHEENADSISKGKHFNQEIHLKNNDNEQRNVTELGENINENQSKLRKKEGDYFFDYHKFAMYSKANKMEHEFETLSLDEQWERLNMNLIFLAIILVYFASIELLTVFLLYEDFEVINTPGLKKETITVGKISHKESSTR